ncbi:SAC3/GANP/Nin1/mts3/eIF-3 p25 family-domain-containing protein [Polychytrium aggregatum]|uniref:SAC3/GANP/Nin1/mts3/eIF-3 p25 family-domain-containing protein n=1 Tax=Polychytrium aggregatum TaxID=110093 RepID=UPI0022FDEB6E|nr:SAC3/GANP/Nin1/mts3/eIF-3 p25 family-domain-containing protein [Polychytrium aggregatum]KAI9209224.1 SAC3/GANP/Nin1/mts3/eIF-3 p25 family-domain-containing protein [Polychytrium aggregatum]
MEQNNRANGPTGRGRGARGRPRGRNMSMVFNNSSGNNTNSTGTGDNSSRGALASPVVSNSARTSESSDSFYGSQRGSNSRSSFSRGSPGRGGFATNRTKWFNNQPASESTAPSPTVAAGDMIDDEDSAMIETPSSRSLEPLPEPLDRSLDQEDFSFGSSDSSAAQWSSKSTGILRMRKNVRPEDRVERFSYVPPDNRYMEMKDQRDDLMNMYVKQKKMAMPGQQYNLGEAPQLAPECLDMCPEFERQEREYSKKLDEFEIDPATGRADPKTTVKRYKRSAAGDPPPLPCDVRPPHVLLATLDFLVYEVLPEYGLDKAHPWIRDRTRAIRTDFTYIQSRGTESIAAHERIARFHIMSHHDLSEIASFSVSQEYEQLCKTLQSLKELYSECARQGIYSPNEAEFIAYYILAHVKSVKATEFEKSLRRGVYLDPLVQRALELQSYIVRSKGEVANYSRFFRKIASSQVSYLEACLLHREFISVRTDALRSMQKVYMSQAATNSNVFPVSDLIRQLAFNDDSEVIKYLEYFQIPFEQDPTLGSYQVIIGKTRQYDAREDKHRVIAGPFYDRHRASLTPVVSQVILHKRKGISDADIIDGRSLLLVRSPQRQAKQPGLNRPDQSAIRRPLPAPPVEPRTTFGAAALFAGSPVAPRPIFAPSEPVSRPPPSMLKAPSEPASRTPAPSAPFSFAAAPTTTAPSRSLWSNTPLAPEAPVSAPSPFFNIPNATPSLDTTLQRPPIAQTPHLPLAAQHAPVLQLPVSFHPVSPAKSMTPTVATPRSIVPESLVASVYDDLVKQAIREIAAEELVSRHRFANEISMAVLSDVAAQAVADVVREVVMECVVEAELRSYAYDNLVDQFALEFVREIVLEQIAQEHHARRQRQQFFALWVQQVEVSRLDRQRRLALEQKRAVELYLNTVAMPPSLVGNGARKRTLHPGGQRKRPKWEESEALNEEEVLSGIILRAAQQSGRYWDPIDFQVLFREIPIPHQSAVECIFHWKIGVSVAGSPDLSPLNQFCSTWLRSKFTPTGVTPHMVVQAGAQKNTVKELLHSRFALKKPVRGGSVFQRVEQCDVVVHQVEIREPRRADASPKVNSESILSGVSALVFQCTIKDGNSDVGSWWRTEHERLLSFCDCVPRHAKIPLLIVFWSTPAFNKNEFIGNVAVKESLSQLFGAGPIDYLDILGIDTDEAGFDVVKSSVGLKLKLGSLVERYPPVQRLKHVVVEDVVDAITNKYFEFAVGHVDKICNKLSFELCSDVYTMTCDMLIELMNNQFSAVEQILTHPVLETIAWPAREFAQRQDSVPPIEWNSDAAFAHLRSVIAKYRLPSLSSLALGTDKSADDDARYQALWKLQSRWLTSLEGYPGLSLDMVQQLRAQTTRILTESTGARCGESQFRIPDASSAFAQLSRLVASDPALLRQLKQRHGI